MLAQAEKLKDRGLLALSCVANENVRRLQGDWQAAREFNERGLNLQPSQPWLVSHRALMEYEVGQFAQGDAYLERMIEAMPATPPGPVAEYHFPALLIPIRARITGDMRWFDTAKQAAQVVRSSTDPKPLVTILGVGHALIPIIQNDAEAAEQAYTEIDQQWRQVDVDSAIVIGMPLVQRVLGLLAATLNRLSASAEHFEDALTFCRKAGYRPELAWTCCDYADTLLQRNEHGDREKAKSLLDESLAISTELGMRPLMERVLSRQDGLQV
jgi:tetratricopeptide (TPR) repeat protein